MYSLEDKRQTKALVISWSFNIEVKWSTCIKFSFFWVLDSPCQLQCQSQPSPRLHVFMKGWHITDPSIHRLVVTVIVPAGNQSALSWTVLFRCVRIMCITLDNVALCVLLIRVSFASISLFWCQRVGIEVMCDTERTLMIVFVKGNFQQEGIFSRYTI